MNRRAALLIVLLSLSAAPLRAQDFKRGDANDSDVIDLSDAVFGLNYLFTGGAAPPCLDAADSNDDGAVDISDSVAVLTFLFAGGMPPAPPYPDCGSDPSGDGLDCASYTHCAASCLGQAELQAALDEGVEPIVCVLAGSVEPIVVSSFEVTVCPVDLAMPCPTPESAEKGCAVEFTQVSGDLDAAALTVTVHIEGLVDDLPIRVKDTTFGNTTDCPIDIDFEGDVIVELLVSDDQVITEILEPTLENTNIELDTSSSSIICRGIVAFKDQFVDELIAQLQAASGELLAGLREDIVGQRLCAE